MEDHQHSDYSNNSNSYSHLPRTWYQGLVSKIGSAAIGLSALFGAGASTPVYAQENPEPQKTLLDRNLESLTRLERNIQRWQTTMNQRLQQASQRDPRLTNYVHTQQKLKEAFLDDINAVNTEDTSRVHYGARHAEDNTKKAQVIRAYETLAETFVLIEAARLDNVVDGVPAILQNYGSANNLLKRVERIKSQATITAKPEQNDDRRAAELYAEVIQKYDNSPNLPRLYLALKGEYDRFIEQYREQVNTGTTPDLSRFSVGNITRETLLNDFKELRETQRAYNTLSASHQRSIVSMDNYLKGMVPDTPEPQPDTPPTVPDDKPDDQPTTPPVVPDTPAPEPDTPAPDTPDQPDDEEDQPAQDDPDLVKKLRVHMPTWLSHSPINGERRNLTDVYAEATGASYRGRTHGESGGGSLSLRNDMFGTGWPVDMGMRAWYEDRAARSNSRRNVLVDGGAIIADSLFARAFFSELKERRRSFANNIFTTPEGLTQTDMTADYLKSLHQAVALEYGFSAEPAQGARLFFNGAIWEKSLRSENNTVTNTNVTGMFQPDPVTLPDGTVVIPPPVPVNEDVLAATTVKNRQWDRGLMLDGGLRMESHDVRGFDRIMLQPYAIFSLTNHDQNAKLQTSVTDSSGTTNSSQLLYDDDFNEGRVAGGLDLDARVSNSFSIVGTGYAGYLETQKIHEAFGSGDLYTAFRTGNSRILVGGGVDYFGEVKDNEYRAGIGFFNYEDEADSQIRLDAFRRVLGRDNRLHMQTWYRPEEVQNFELMSLRDLGAAGIAYADMGVFQFGGEDSSRYGLKGRIVLPLSAFLRREDLDSFIHGFDASVYFHGSFLDSKRRNDFKFEKTYNGVLGVSVTFADFVRLSLEGGIQRGALSTTGLDGINRHIGMNLEFLLGPRRREEEKKRSR